MTVQTFGAAVKNPLYIAAGAVLMVVLTGCGFNVTVEEGSWMTGSADVAGTIENSSGVGCSDPEITLHLRDHNGAIVRDFTFGAGDLAAGQKRKWRTHMIGLLVDAPVESNVRAIDADATCADKH